MQVASEKTILLDFGEVLKEIEERELESLVACIDLADDD
jgi:hypothetical protein